MVLSKDRERDFITIRLGAPRQEWQVSKLPPDDGSSPEFRDPEVVHTSSLGSLLVLPINKFQKSGGKFVVKPKS